MICTAGKTKTYATVDADIDVYTEGKGVSTIQPSASCWILVGGTGDLHYVGASGLEDTIAAIPANTLLWLRAQKILDTGTTVTKLTVGWP